MRRVDDGVEILDPHHPEVRDRKAAALQQACQPYKLNFAAIGNVVRASRKAQKIRQDDAAGSIGVSENFLGKVERGGESVQWGKLFQVLEGLGIRVMLDVPDSVAAWLNDTSSGANKP